jgi:hypothetical protein
MGINQNAKSNLQILHHAGITGFCILHNSGSYFFRKSFYLCAGYNIHLYRNILLIMKANLIFSILFLLAYVAPLQSMAQSGNAALQGAWTINKVEIKKTVDNSPPTSKVFNSGDDMSFGFIQTPVKIIFTADQVTFEYANYESVGTYSLQGSTLRVGFASHSTDYNCTFPQGSIRLSQTVNYVINDDEASHQAKEEYTFHGNK